MSLELLSFLVFLSTLGASLSVLYFTVEAPAKKKRMRTRFETVQQIFLSSSQDGEVLRLQDEALSEMPALNLFLLRFPVARRIQEVLTQAAIPMRVDRFLLLSFVLTLFGLLTGGIVQYPLPGTILLGLLAGGLPLAFVLLKRKQRFARFEERFPDAIDLLARAVRAGHAFTSGFELIANEMPQPVADEFRITYEQQNLGMPLREALNNLGRRMPLNDVGFFISALQIQRESGGNLAEILDKLSYVMRERFKIFRQVKTHTAEARVSLYILTAVPPMTAVLLYIVNPEYAVTLIEEPMGHVLIMTAIVLQIVGYLIMRKIADLEV